LVTEQPQYSVVVCIFSTSQNTEISLIPNGLHFIFTYPQSLALAILLHTARHSFATVLKRAGANIAYISESLGHQDLKTTENYLASFEREEREKNAAILIPDGWK